MPAVSRVGDEGSHGGADIGTILSGIDSVKTNGITTAFVGSEYSCPVHGIVSIISSPVSNVGNGLDIAVVGSVTSCGAIIFQGSPNTNAD
jgi:uncharacterized Zn-binding protein involved in type VI secretion